MLLRMGLIGIALVVAAVVVFQNVGNVFQDPNERPAIRLTEEVTRTNRTASRLDSSFANVLPPALPAQNVSMALPASQPGSGISRQVVPDGDGNTSPRAPSQPGSGQDPQAESSDGQGPDVGAGPEPTPDRYPEYNNPTDLAAGEAAASSDELVEEFEVQETEYSRAVEQFYDEWSARYNLALDSHKRFHWRVDRASAIAAEYFQRQAHLTSLMTNPERQEVFRSRDRQEQELYRQWQLQANGILAQSDTIMKELRQFNLEITKVRLSANFMALHQEFQTIPHAVSQLHNDLALFRARSEQLQQSFNPGAVYNQ